MVTRVPTRRAEGRVVAPRMTIVILEAMGGQPMLARVALCIFGVLPAIGFAQGRAYLGIAPGLSILRAGCGDTPPGSSMECDNQSTAIKVFGGLQFTRNWGIEAQYVD